MEEHLSVEFNVLDAVDRMEDQRKRQHAQHDLQLGNPVELSHPRRREEEPGIKNRGNGHAQIEDRIVVHLRRGLLLDKRLAESAVHEDIRDRDEDRQQRHRSVVVRREETRQHKRHDKVDRLNAELLHQHPEKALRNLVRQFAHMVLPLRQITP